MLSFTLSVKSVAFWVVIIMDISLFRQFRWCSGVIRSLTYLVCLKLTFQYDVIMMAAGQSSLVSKS